MAEKKTKIVIRPAVAMDSVNIVRLIKAGYYETGASEIGPLDEQKLLEYVTTTLRHAFVLVAEQHIPSKGGRIHGTIALAPIRMPWCSIAVLAECWFAVTDAYRSRGIPQQLVEATDTFLDQRNMVGFYGTQMLTPPALNDVFEERGRQGYREARHTFIRLPNQPTAVDGRPVLPPKRQLAS